MRKDGDTRGVWGYRGCGRTWGGAGGLGGPCRDGWGGWGSGVNAGLRKAGQMGGPGTVCGVAGEVAVQMGRGAVAGDRSCVPRER